MSCPIQNWEQSVARSPSYRFPATPSAKLKDLQGNAKIQELYSTRDWEVCASCRRSGVHFELKKCIGCAGSPGSRVLYCSHTCQRKAWPTHQKFCGEEAVKSMQKRLGPGVDVQVWRNFGRVAAKRIEGMKYILKWAFEEIWIDNPTIDFRETCFSVFCHSSGEGKGPIFLDGFQLQSMDNTPYGLPPNLVSMMQSNLNLAVIYLFVDGISHEPMVTQLQLPGENEPHLPQWPWIVATITALRNRNAELGMIRLQTLAQRVWTLVKHDKDEMRKFQGPDNLGNGKRWNIHSFDRWQGSFGKVIKF